MHALEAHFYWTQKKNSNVSKKNQIIYSIPIYVVQNKNKKWTSSIYTLKVVAHYIVIKFA